MGIELLESQFLIIYILLTQNKIIEYIVCVFLEYLNSYSEIYRSNLCTCLNILKVELLV